MSRSEQTVQDRITELENENRKLTERISFLEQSWSVFLESTIKKINITSEASAEAFANLLINEAYGSEEAKILEHDGLTEEEFNIISKNPALLKKLRRKLFDEIGNFFSNYDDDDLYKKGLMPQNNAAILAFQRLFFKTEHRSALWLMQVDGIDGEAPMHVCAIDQKTFPAIKTGIDIEGYYKKFVIILTGSAHDRKVIDLAENAEHVKLLLSPQYTRKICQTTGKLTDDISKNDTSENSFNEIFRNVLYLLEKSKNLKVLSIGNFYNTAFDFLDLTNDQVEKLKQHISKSTLNKIKFFPKIDSNNFNDRALDLFNALLQPNIESFSLSYSYTDDTLVSENAARLFIKAIENNTSLTTLNLSSFVEPEKHTELLSSFIETIKKSNIINLRIRPIRPSYTILDPIIEANRRKCELFDILTGHSALFSSLPQEENATKAQLTQKPNDPAFEDEDKVEPDVKRIKLN